MDSFYVRRDIVIVQKALCGILPIIERNYFSELFLNRKDHTA
jgi:hypothetical protein